MDDFSAAPMSIGELRARKSGKGADWTPRDALVDTLRRIDQGEISPDGLVVVFGKNTPEGRSEVQYVQATANLTTAFGMLSMATMQLHRDGFCDHD